jgi:hypothetical protein
MDETGVFTTIDQSLVPLTIKMILYHGSKTEGDPARQLFVTFNVSRTSFHCLDTLFVHCSLCEKLESALTVYVCLSQFENENRLIEC